jgi:asparaginyl-tRNA synthetase
MFPLIKEILTSEPDGRQVTVRGWVRTKRDLKNLAFIEINDGSCFASIQATCDREAAGDAALDAASLGAIDALSTGASVEVSGALVPSPAAGQTLELQAKSVTLVGEAPPEIYPLQKKRHSLEFLREIAHLRARTNTFGAVFRVRSRLAMAIHQYFQEHGFFYINTPIITASDAEGAGEMFQVTTLDLQKPPRRGPPSIPPTGGERVGAAGASPPVGGTEGGIDYSKDFFGKRTSLTVSGQLEGETMATALSRIYTFGPTFRAENSNTSRHLAEFWMIEPEAAFFHLEDDMALAEDFLKYVFGVALKDCAEDLAFFDSRIQKGVIETLRQVAESSFKHLPYTEAIAVLEDAMKHGVQFEYKPFWGCDLQSEHERFLTEEAAKGPVIVTDYPREIKAFYMKANNDGKTVRAMDVLVPRLGEIIGGSEREEDLSKLEARIRELGMEPEDYKWYLDLRRFGSVPHSGFGLGFERLIQYVTGMQNIRDVIPYPRAVGQAEF